MVPELFALSTSSDGFLDDVSALRGIVADLQAFITSDTQGSTAGIAFRPGSSSITARTYMAINRITFFMN